MRVSLLDVPHSSSELCPCGELWTDDALLYRVAYLNASLRHPAAVCIASFAAPALDAGVSAGTARDLPVIRTQERIRLSAFDDARMVRLHLSRPAELWFARDVDVDAEAAPSGTLVAPGTDGAVHAWVLPPPGVNPDPTATHSAPPASVPVVVLLHGGPQSCWEDDWHPRWNAQLLAAAGFCVVAPNFAGSTSFVQGFADQARLDWGGAPKNDVLIAIRLAAQAYPWIDATRVALVGASFGGYLANWMAATADPGQFRCIVSRTSNVGPQDLCGTIAAIRKVFPL
jgi:dienelactone hydrolase